MFFLKHILTNMKSSEISIIFEYATFRELCMITSSVLNGYRILNSRQVHSFSYGLGLALLFSFVTHLHLMSCWHTWLISVSRQNMSAWHAKAVMLNSQNKSHNRILPASLKTLFSLAMCRPHVPLQPVASLGCFIRG